MTRPAGRRPAASCTTTPWAPATASPASSSCSTPSPSPGSAGLPLGHVTVHDTTVRLHLGSAPITLPGPVADLTLQLLEGKRGHATTGTGGPSPWLFPGGQPGRPIHATHLGQRLKDLGIQPGQARSTALFQLATELPAAMLARMLGIHIDVAVAWQRASAGDWMNYAADISRRHNTADSGITGDDS